MFSFSKTHIIGIVVLLALIIGFFIYRFIKNKRQASANGSNGSDESDGIKTNPPITSSDLKVASIMDDSSLYDDTSQQELTLNNTNIERCLGKSQDKSRNIDRMLPKHKERVPTPIPVFVQEQEPEPITIEEIIEEEEKENTYEKTLQFIKESADACQDETSDDDLFNLDMPTPVNSRINLKLKGGERRTSP